MPLRNIRTNHRALSLWGVLIGLALVLIGISLLASTGAFAFAGLAGFFNGTYLSYVFYDAIGTILIVAGVIAAWVV